VKIEITKAQLEAIKLLADDTSAMCGVAGPTDDSWRKAIRLIDRMLAKNKLAPRAFS
jgi:hypothetical protein